MAKYAALASQLKVLTLDSKLQHGADTGFDHNITPVFRGLLF